LDDLSKLLNKTKKNVILNASLYANFQGIIQNNEYQLRKSTNALHEVSNEYKFKISKMKTKIMFRTILSEQNMFRRDF